MEAKVLKYSKGETPAAFMSILYPFKESAPDFGSELSQEATAFFNKVVG